MAKTNAAKTLDGEINPATGRPWPLTKARRAQFLATLAVTCNITRACKAAGMDNCNVYKFRAKDPVFARQWEEALAQGYLYLEGELLHRALGDTTGGDADGDVVGTDMPLAPFDPNLALKLLAHRQRADPQGRRGPVKLKQPSNAEVLDALDRKLTAMEKRLGKQREGEAQ